MKVTTEDLLDLFGLKVGDKIKIHHKINNEIVEEIGEIYFSNSIFLRNDIPCIEFKNKNIDLTYLLNKEYEIIKPKPTLTDDEKEIVKAFSKNAIKVEFIVGMLFFKNEIGEQIGALSLSEDSKKQFENLKTYDIKELLDE